MIYLSAKRFTEVAIQELGVKIFPGGETVKDSTCVRILEHAIRSKVQGGTALKALVRESKFGFLARAF